MPWHRESIATLHKRIVGDMQAHLGLPYIPQKSVLDVLSKVYAGAVHGLYGYGAYLQKQVFPFSAEAEYLEQHASWWGIARKQAQKARGTVQFAGTTGVIFPEGVRITAGSLVFISTSSSIVENGIVHIAVEALEAGTGGTIPQDTPLQLLSPLAGIFHEGKVHTAIAGGSDAENDDSLRSRLLQRIQNPPASGTVKDYERFTLEQEAHGVAVRTAWVYPCEIGIGTVTIRFITEEGIPTAQEVQKVQEYIESVRPITAEVFVVAPIAVPLHFEIAGLQPATHQVQQAVEEELRSLLLQEAQPNTLLRISHVREAISIATGEIDHELVYPTHNVEYGVGELCTFGGITWL